MKGNKLLLTFLIFIFLAGYFYIFEVKKKKEEEKEKQKEEQLFYGLKKDDVVEIRVKNKNGKFIFKKYGNDWKIEEPIKDFADNNTISNIASTYSNGKIERRIKDVDLKELKLDKGEVICELITKDNKKYKVVLGEKNPTGSYVYARYFDKKDEVFLLGVGLKNTCDKNLFDFRYKGILRLEPDSIKKIEVKLKDKNKQYVLKKDKNNKWQVIKPKKEIADKYKVEAIINYFKNSTVKSILPLTEKNLKKYKLKNSKEYLKFYEDNKVKLAYFGKVDDKNHSVYVKSARLKNNIFEVQQYVYKNISTYDEIIDKHLMLFDQDKVEKVSVKYGNKFLEAIKVKDKKSNISRWKFTKLEGIKKDDVKNYNAGNIVSTIRWREYKKKIKLTPKIDEKKYGITDKAVIKMYDKDGKILMTILFGKMSKEKDELYIKILERKAIFLVDKGIYNSLTSLPDFKIE